MFGDIYNAARQIFFVNKEYGYRRLIQPISGQGSTSTRSLAEILNSINPDTSFARPGKNRENFSDSEKVIMNVSSV